MLIEVTFIMILGLYFLMIAIQKILRLYFLMIAIQKGFCWFHRNYFSLDIGKLQVTLFQDLS